MTLLRSVVAPAGVLLDSSAVVVGSMVLAPLFGPAVSARVGTVIDEPDLFWEGLRLQGSPSASRGARRGRTPLRGPPVGQPARAPNSNGSSSPTVSRLTPTTRRCARINDRVRERAGDDVTVDGRVTLVYRDVEGEISPGAGGPVYRFSLEHRRKLFRPSAVS